MTTVGDYKNVTPNLNETKNFLKRKSRKFTFLKFSNCIWKLFKTLVIFSLIFTVAMHFAPELKESMPQVYTFIENTLFRYLNFIFGLLNKLF